MGLEGYSTTLVVKYIFLLFGATALLLHISNHPGFPFGDPDKFVVVLTSYAGFESRIVAGRASRQVVPTLYIHLLISHCLLMVRVSVSGTSHHTFLVAGASHNRGHQ
jgi:hypothetical protein